MADLTAEQLASLVDGTTSGDIAQSIARLIRRRILLPGDRLPTVRSLAGSLDVGRSAVSDAWRILAEHSFIETARRNGTVVRERGARGSLRYWSVPAAPEALQVDLSTGTPDTELLPALGPALATLSDRIPISSYIDQPVLPELEEHLVAAWPTPPEAITVVDGALDALDRTVGALVSLGDVVVVEDPTFPPLLDMLDLAGADVVGVPIDERGMLPDALADALARDPVACFVQPWAHNPTGAAIDDARLAELSTAFNEHPGRPWIVEDDHTAASLAGHGVSIAALAPERSVTIVSFSKTHGPDLRLAAIGGAADIVEQIVERRRLGPTWTSRLLQQLLLVMLSDEATADLVESARMLYRLRREALTVSLGERGIDVAPGVGLNLWVPVPDEQRTTWALAIERIGVAPGRPFRVDPTASHHLRVSIGNARGDLDAIAAAIATAADASR